MDIFIKSLSINMVFPKDYQSFIIVISLFDDQKRHLTQFSHDQVSNTVPIYISQARKDSKAGSSDHLTSKIQLTQQHILFLKKVTTTSIKVQRFHLRQVQALADFPRLYFTKVKFWKSLFIFSRFLIQRLTQKYTFNIKMHNFYPIIMKFG